MLLCRITEKRDRHTGCCKGTFKNDRMQSTFYRAGGRGMTPLPVWFQATLGLFPQLTVTALGHSAAYWLEDLAAL